LIYLVFIGATAVYYMYPLVDKYISAEPDNTPVLTGIIALVFIVTGYSLGWPKAPEYWKSAIIYGPYVGIFIGLYLRISEAILFVYLVIFVLSNLKKYRFVELIKILQ